MLGAWFRDEMCNKCIADPKAYRLEISEPGLRFVVIYMRPVRTQPGVLANLEPPLLQIR